MSLEDILTGWTGPSSNTEQEKQDRTERMIRQAIEDHPQFKSCSLQVFAKGSYANNTNVKADSDVDIAVECTEAEYWGEAAPGAHKPGSAYAGIWTPAKLRTELGVALRAKFPGQVDTSGSTAIRVNSGSSRVDADVVPCFTYRYYFATSAPRKGTMIFKTSGESIVNYPVQQLENGRAKNVRSGSAYKRAVRVLKRVENAMVESKSFHELPSYFMECLAYNCPDPVFANPTWTATIRAMILHIWQGLQGDEPTDSSARWLEANDCFYLFHSGQKWSRNDGREFAQAAWKYLGYK